MTRMPKTPEDRLRELGIVLPPPPAPVALYDAVAQAGPFLWVSGQLPFEQGALRFAGKVGSQLSPEEGAEAARLCAVNGMSQMRKALGSLDRVLRIPQLCIYVNSAPGFTGQPAVANGASEFLVSILGDAGRHSRVAVGVSELPLDAAVELSLVVHVGPEETG